MAPYIYLCVFYLHICLSFKIVYACEHCKILIAGNTTFMCAITSQIVPVHIMWVISAIVPLIS